MLLPIGHDNTKFVGVVLNRMLPAIHRASVEDNHVCCILLMQGHRNRISDLTIGRNRINGDSGSSQAGMMGKPTVRQWSYASLSGPSPSGCSADSSTYSVSPEAALSRRACRTMAKLTAEEVTAPAAITRGATPEA